MIVLMQLSVAWLRSFEPSHSIAGHGKGQADCLTGQHQAAEQGQ
jgi:DUF971 family protein